MSSPEDESESKKRIMDRIKELKEGSPDVSNDEIGKTLLDEKYKVNDIVKHLKVNINSLNRTPNKEANVDEAVLDAAAIKTLEDFKDWAKKQTHLTIKEISELGQGIIEMGVKEKAASQSMPLWDYVRNAISFYNSFYDTVIKLMKLKVINLDGKVDRELLLVEEATEA